MSLRRVAQLVWDPPVPFRWSYGAVQLGGALLGWTLGADVGVATVLVVLLVGPAVDLVSQVVFRTAPDRVPRPKRYHRPSST